MHRFDRGLAIVASAFLVVAASTPPAAALEKPAASCQKSLGKALLKFKKSKIKAWTKCLDATLAGKTCDSIARDAAIAEAASDAAATIEEKCSDSVLFGAQPAGVGFVVSPSCALKSGVGSSRVDLQACKLEYSIVSPK